MDGNGSIGGFLFRMFYPAKVVHFDGLRMDAISRAIYWMGDSNRGVNTNSLEFLKQMNGGFCGLSK